MKIYKPKEEYVQSINIQNAYVELLKAYHKELSDKIKSSKGFQLAKYNVEIYELASKLDEQIMLLQEKISHFDNNFIEQYDAELKECEENFEETLENVHSKLKIRYDDWHLYLQEKENYYKGFIKNNEISTPEDVTDAIVLSIKVENARQCLKTIYDFRCDSKNILDNKKDKIDFLINDWKKLEFKDQNHIEIKNVLYKDLKNLVIFPEI